MTLDAANNLIVADWSDPNGGIKYAAPDLNSGGVVLAQQNGPTGGVLGVNGIPVHGSIPTTPYVTGSVGNNLTVWAMDEDLHETLNPAPGANNHGNHIWKWTVGNETNGYNVEPTLVVNVNALSRTSDNRMNYVSINNGTSTEAFYSPQTKKWYISENRFDGNEAGFIVVSVNPGDYNKDSTINTADYVGWRKSTPNDAQGYADFRESFSKPANSVDWSSLQFSIDHQLDGNNSITSGGTSCNTGSGTCGIQDIFRGMGGEITISPDGQYLFVRQTDLRTVNAQNVINGPRPTNPYFGTAAGADPNLQGAVIVIPLDANGLPNIQVSGPGGTLTNIKTIDIGVGASSSSRRAITVDIAGNVYVGDANSERLKVYSPGGATLATTRSNGTFSLGPASGDLLAGEVPEPTAVTLAMLGMLLAVGCRRSRQTEIN
jgi:hypothetical protein